MKYVDFVLTGDPARAKATVSGALEQRRFRLTWRDDWTATAERGSAVANVLLGAFAQRFVFELEIRSLAEGESLVRILTRKSGWMGGLIGVHRTRKQLVGLKDELAGVFSSAGVLKNVQSDA
jgi:hypothetical protein